MTAELTPREEAPGLLDAVEAAGQAPAPQACCHLHKPDCCDPEDCGPCCSDCPTCPTLRLARVQCATCGHGQHTGPCMVLTGHVSRIIPKPCGCDTAPAPQPETASDVCPRCGRPAGEHVRPCTITTTWPATAPDTCGRCGHPAAEHHPGDGCWACPDDTTAWQHTYTATVPDAEPGTPDPVAAAIRAGHNYLTGLASVQATLGTPDDAREQLREQYAALLLDGHGRLQPRHVADPLLLIRRLLAVRDDALTTAQQRAAEWETRWKNALIKADQQLAALDAEVKRNAAGEERPVLFSVYNAMHLRALDAECRTADAEQRERERLDQLRDAEEGITAATRQRKAAEAARLVAEQRITAALQLHPRTITSGGHSWCALCIDHGDTSWPCATVAALAPALAQDGDPS